MNADFVVIAQSNDYQDKYKNMCVYLRKPASYFDGKFILKTGAGIDRLSGNEAYRFLHLAMKRGQSVAKVQFNDIIKLNDILIVQGNSKRQRRDARLRRELSRTILRLSPCAQAACRLVKFVLAAALLRNGSIPYLWKTCYRIPAMESHSSKTYLILMKFLPA